MYQYAATNPMEQDAPGQGTDEDLFREPEFINRVLEVSPAGILVLNSSGHIIFANPRAEQVLGLTKHQLIEISCDTSMWHISQLVGGDTAAGELPLRQVMATGQPLSGVRTVVDLPDGRCGWLMINAAPLFNRAGHVDKIVVTIEDITEQEETRQALEQRTQLYNTLVEQVPAVVYVSALDEIGTTLYISPQIERMIGFTADEWLADPELWIKRLHPDDRERMLSEFARFRETGEPFRCEYRSITRAGREVWVYEEAVVLPQRRGQYQLHQGILVDITERKKAEEALRQTEAKYRSIVENATVGIFRSAFDGKYIAANPALARIFGYASPEDLMGSVTNIAHQLFIQPERRHEIIRVIMENPGMHRFEVEYRRKDGQVFTAMLDLRVVRDEHSTPLYLEGFVDDITEHKRMEAQLRQAMKMEAIGQLAGGVAHDFNNLLTAILGYNDLMLQRLNEHDPLYKDAQEVKKAAQQASSLTSQLLAFSRKQMLQPRVINLNDVVANVEKMLRRLIGEHIELITHLDPNLLAVKADPNQIEQIIVNLAVNARDAMPQGGQLRIETTNRDLDEGFVRLHVGSKAGRYVALTISDAGQGMDAETLSHLFEPFFTTKEQGKGTGLGLATVYGIVKQSDGYIWVDSELRKGTTFTIYLPQVDQEVEAPLPGALHKERGERPAWETVLVVEDNDLVRDLICDVLEQTGYTALSASSGAQALQVYAGHHGPIHLLLSDVVMPSGMSGIDLAGRITSMCPHIKVLLLSGYTQDTLGQYGTFQGQMVFLQKPFTPDTLVDRVREILDAPGGGDS